MVIWNGRPLSLSKKRAMFCLFGIRVPFALRCVHGKLRCAGTPTKSLLRDHAMAPATASPRPLLVCHSGQWPAASRVLPCTPPPLDLALARAVGAPEKGAGPASSVSVLGVPTRQWKRLKSRSGPHRSHRAAGRNKGDVRYLKYRPR